MAYKEVDLTHLVPKERVAVMFSGGIDSTTILASLLKEKNVEVYVLAFDDDSANFRTRRSIAIESIVNHYGISERLHMIRMYNSEFLRGQDAFGLIPGYKMLMQIACMSYCQKLECTKLFMGYNRENEEYAYTFKDELAENIQKTADLFEHIYDYKVEMCMPYLHLSKNDIIESGNLLEVPFEKTISCRSTAFGGLVHCGKCMPCQSRMAGFKDARIDDPTVYWYTDGRKEKITMGGPGTVVLNPNKRYE